jgi:hypothetical protein
MGIFPNVIKKVSSSYIGMKDYYLGNVFLKKKAGEKMAVIPTY